MKPAPTVPRTFAAAVPCLLSLLSLLSLLAAPLAAQRPLDPETAAVRLHEAWLREVLDLDVRGAAQDYAALVRDTHASAPEHWLAIARQCELRRLGEVREPVPAADAPAPLQKAFAAVQTPLAVDDLLARARIEPAVLLQSFATDAGRLPSLRPLVFTVQEWARSQMGPSVDDRYYQRVQAQQRMRPRPTNPRTTPNRAGAFDVLNAELRGNTRNADFMRLWYFGDWKPPVTTEPPEQLLARARANLEAWLKELPATSSDAVALGRLRDAFEQRAAANPAAMLELLRRLPAIGDRLLAPPK